MLNLEGMKEKKMNIVGTPDYIAPEILRQEAQTPSLDWWALGVMMYEFIVGLTPFGALTKAQVFKNIENLKITWPDCGTEENQVSPPAMDLMKKLLQPDPSKRLGSKSVEEIKSHSFFKEINWETIRKQEPVFVPEVSNILDTQYFNIEKAGFETDDFAKGKLTIAEDEEKVRFTLYIYIYIIYIYI